MNARHTRSIDIPHAFPSPMTKRLVGAVGTSSAACPSRGGRVFASTATRPASMGHPVTSRPPPSPSRRREKALAKWWGVLFCLPFPRLGNSPDEGGREGVLGSCRARSRGGPRDIRPLPDSGWRRRMGASHPIAGAGDAINHPRTPCHRRVLLCSSGSYTVATSTTSSCERRRK